MEPSHPHHNHPLVLILGPTGAGKTKLSLRMAEVLNGEIVNSDAFSIYKTADVMIAKATLEERNLVKHHLIDIKELDETGYKVLDYSRDCEDVAKDIFSRGKIPIVVGGTNYYVESLLFEKVDNSNINEYSENDFELNLSTCEVEICNIISDIKSIVNSFSSMNYNKDDKDDIDIVVDNIHFKLNEYLDILDVTLLTKILSLVDPAYQTFLHKNDTRRIKNGIIFYFTFNKRKSDKLSKETLKLKHPDSIIIFLNPVSFDLLQSRIENRIEEMLTANNSSGLIEVFTILKYFKDKFWKDNLEEHFTEGVLQAIGYKEFYPIFKLLPDQANISIEDIKKLVDSNLNIYEECVQKLKSNTIKYAKKQYKFIKQRILPNMRSENVLEIKIEEYKKEKVEECISSAESSIKKLLNSLTNGNNSQSNANKNLSENGGIETIQYRINKISLWKKYFCEICNKEINGENEYSNHIKSNKHKKRKRKIPNNNYPQIK